MKNLDEKDLKKVNGGAEGFELHPEDPELDGRLIVKTGPEGKKGSLFILPYPVQQPLQRPPMPVLRNMCQTSAHPEV